MTPLELTRVVFGISNEDVETAARQSTRSFVRDQDHIAYHSPGATGRVMNAIEALRAFGLDKLYEAWEYGAAIIVGKADEPGSTIRKQREALGLTPEHLADSAGCSVATIEAIERSATREDIHVLEQICQMLTLDERLITWVPGAGSDGHLAVRLREYSSGHAKLSPSAVTELSEAAWVARTEHRIQTWLGKPKAKWRSFQGEYDYGDRNRPAWRVGYELAERTRRALGLTSDEPIHSMRELIIDLGIALVQTELPGSLAGATVAVDGQRSIVVNAAGPNSNPWIRRATIAHEVGHLLWDPEQRLNHLKVDAYADLEESYTRHQDVVEARANAFAIAFLAPPREVIRIFSAHLAEPNVGLRTVMEHFGISRSAAKFHILNSYNNAGRPLYSGLDLVRCDASATNDWIVRENMTLDWFPIHTTPLSRRGYFAACVVEAERDGQISSNTAASYLRTTEAIFESSRDTLMDALSIPRG